MVVVSAKPILKEVVTMEKVAVLMDLITKILILVKHLVDMP